MKTYFTSSCSKLSSRQLDAVAYSTSLFKCGEIQIKTEKSSDQCCIVTSIATHDEFMEVLLLINALRATNVILVILYLFYSRQDDIQQGQSAGAQLVSTIIEQQKNVQKIYVLDPHSNFFTKNCSEISAIDLFQRDIQKIYSNDYAIVAPDAGISGKAMRLANALNVPFVQCNKDRSNNLYITISGDIPKKNCILIDDIVDSGATICNAATTLVEHGVGNVVCYCTHGVLSAGSSELIMNSPISELVITDSILRCDNGLSKIRRISVLPLVHQIIDGML